RIERKEPRSPLELTSYATTDLELEPKLAEHMDGLGHDQLTGLAILTLWVTRNGNCALVKVEILEDYKTRVKKVGYSLQGDIEYTTLLVTAEGAKPGKGNDLEWEKVGRMNSVAKAWKGQVNAYKMRIKDVELNQVAAQMNAVFQESMQS